MNGLNQKRVMITGGASGIGLATARRFYEEGAQLCLIDLPALASTSLEETFPERLTYIQGNICDSAALNAIQKHIEDVGVDILVNNAGIIRDASLGKMTIEQWDQVIAVNLTAVFQMSQLVAPAMKAQQSGVILNAASVVAHYGNYGQANYVATKAGVIGMTKTLGKELGRFNIRVNAVAPGFINTEMVNSIPEDIQKMMCDKTPLQRLGKPEEVAALYAFLASDDAAFITASCMNIDGGLVVG